jgi:subtilisin family serine protease
MMFGNNRNANAKSRDKKESTRMLRRFFLGIFACVFISMITAFADDAPTISYFTPTGGPAGTNVVIYGANFDGVVAANNQVVINGAAATILEVAKDEMTIEVPTGATSGPISVTTTAGAASSADPFVVSNLTVTVEPVRAGALIDSTISINALVSGAANSSVRWYVNGIEGGDASVGTVTAANPTAFKAPYATPDPSLVMVAATSEENPAVKAVAQIRVYDLKGGVPDLDPPSADYSKFTQDETTGLNLGRTRILVQMASGGSTAALTPVLGQINGTVIGGLPETGAMLIEIPDSEDLKASDAALIALGAVSGVEAVAQDALLSPTTLEEEPTDNCELYTDTGSSSVPAKSAWSWEVNPTGYNWGMEYASFPCAWNWMSFIKRNANRVINVGVVDSGCVVASHVDFTSNLTNVSKADYDNHATHVSGIIGAEWDDRAGITGASPFVHIWAQPYSVVNNKNGLTALGDDLLHTFRLLLRRADYVPIRVVNFSQGYNWFSNQFGTFHDLNGNNKFEYIDTNHDGNRDTLEWSHSWPWRFEYNTTTGIVTKMILTGCTPIPQNVDAAKKVVRAHGLIAQRIAEYADGPYPASSSSPKRPSFIIVAAAGNDRHDLKGLLKTGFYSDATSNMANGEANRDTWNSDEFRAEFSSPFCNAAYNGASNIVVVEALKRRGNRDSIARADFSCRAIDGDTGAIIKSGLSAPGVSIFSTTFKGTQAAPDVHAYELMNGTSMAAPHVTGLIAYLYSIDPLLDKSDVVTILRDTGRADSFGVRTAAPSIDAFKAVMAIDNLASRPEIKKKLLKKALLNVDDGTMDGDDRNVEADVHGSVSDVNGNGYIDSEDIKIDMADFRRFRDSCLIVKNTASALNGPTRSKKRDLNEDLVWGSHDKENVYPRCDFNGDGMIYVAGADGTNDLDVMADAEIWGDADVKAVDSAELKKKLSRLIYSGDLKIDPAGLFTDGIDKIKVFAAFGEAAATKEVFSVTLDSTNVVQTGGDDKRKILTVPSKQTFRLYARAYSGSTFKKFLLPQGGISAGPLEHGEDKTLTLLSATVASTTPSLTVDPGVSVMVGLALETSDGQQYAIDPSIFTVAWTTPSGGGNVSSTSSGWSYTAASSPGVFQIQAQVQLDGESVNSSDEPYAAIEATVTSGTIKSPSGMAVDSSGNMYISDAEDGTIVMVPKGKEGFVLLNDLDEPGDVELSSNGRSLVVAEADGKIESFIFGVSGRVKNFNGDYLVGATVVGQTAITGTPGSGDSTSWAKTDGNGWFHLFWLLEPPVGKNTADAVVTVEYQGRAQAFLVTVGPQGQTIRDITFDMSRLTINVTGGGVTDPPEGFYDYERNTIVSIKATPKDGWKFDHWDGLDSAAVTDNPAKVTLYVDVTATAIFVEDESKSNAVEKSSLDADSRAGGR